MDRCGGYVVGVASAVRHPYPSEYPHACYCCWGGVCGNLSHLPVEIILNRRRRDDDGATAKE